MQEKGQHTKEIDNGSEQNQVTIDESIRRRGERELGDNIYCEAEQVNGAERPVQELEGTLCRTDSNNLPAASSVPTDKIPRAPGIVSLVPTRRGVSPPSRYLGVVSNAVSFPPVTISQANLTQCS